MGPWNTGTIVLDLVDPEGTGPPLFFAIDCNNLGIYQGTVPGTGCPGEHRAPWHTVSGFLASTIAFPCHGGGRAPGGFGIDGARRRLAQGRKTSQIPCLAVWWKTS